MSFKDLANLAESNNFKSSLCRFLRKRYPSQETLLRLIEEADNRLETVFPYLVCLLEEGQEVWEDRWKEEDVDFGWDEQIDGLCYEVEVNTVVLRWLTKVVGC